MRINGIIEDVKCFKTFSSFMNKFVQSRHKNVDPNCDFITVDKITLYVRCVNFIR